MAAQHASDSVAPSQTPPGSTASTPGGAGASGALKSGLRGQDFAAGERALAPVQKKEATGQAWGTAKGSGGALREGMAGASGELGKGVGSAAVGTNAAITGTKSATLTRDQGETPKGGDTETKAEGMTGLSQFVWVSAGGKDLTFDEAKQRIPIVCGDMGLGTYDGEILTPEKKEQGYNPNNGYYWFNEDGTPTWSGTNGGVKAIKVGMKWSTRLNAWSDFLASNPVGKRPGFIKDGGGGKVSFSATAKEGYVEVPGKVKDLDVKHVPGAASCFATVTAMLDQVGLTPQDGADGFGEMVTGESYTTATQTKYDEGGVTDEATKLAVEYFRKGFTEKGALAEEVWYALHPEKVVDGTRQPVDKTNDDEKKAYGAVAKVCNGLCGEKKTVASVEVDLKESRRSLAYIDFETGAGRPVMVGVTYTARNGNGSFTDHWVVINGRQGEGRYGYYDPASTSTADSEDEANVFVWNEGEGYLQSTAKHPYVVSWVRPNAQSLKEWQAHEATLGTN